MSHVFKSDAFLPGSHFKSFGPTLRKFKYLSQRQEGEIGGIVGVGGGGRGCEMEGRIGSRFEVCGRVDYDSTGSDEARLGSTVQDEAEQGGCGRI